MFKSDHVFLCVGRRGTGKSYLGRVIQEMYPRRVIFDTALEYDDPENTVYSFPEFCDRLLGYAIEIQNKQRFEFKIIFQFPAGMKERELIFEKACQVLYEMGNLQLVVEEIQRFCTPHKMDDWLENCFLIGRHRGLSILATSQRPGVINKTIMSQADHIFAGQLHDRNDLYYVSNFIGVDTYKLVNMPPQYFLHFQPGAPLELVHNSLTKARPLPQSTASSAPPLPETPTEDPEIEPEGVNNV